MKQRSGMPYDVVAFSTDEKALLLTLAEEGAFHRLLRHAWINGSVPDHLASLAQICRCPEETMTEMWVRLEYFWRLDGRTGRRTNPKQEHERKYLKGKAEAGSKGGSNAQAKRKQTSSTTGESASSKTQAPFPSLPVSSPSLPKEEANIENNSPPPDSAAVEVRAANADEAADFFCLKYREFLSTACITSPKDFVQLARLRKANNVPARASPDGWDDAVLNYFASPISSPSLADLAARFATFRNSPVDRYGVPINHAGGSNGQHRENPNDRAAKDFVRRALASPLQPDVPNVRKDS